MSNLHDQQLRAYEAQGYLLASGLVAEGVAAAAESAMWRLVGVSPDDPGSWKTVAGGHKVYDEPSLLALYTPDLCAAAARLAGDESGNFPRPRRAYAINVFPVTGEWRWPAPHIDHAIREHGHRTFPRAFRIACMLFLNDVPPHGGGTVVWPASHRRLEAVARDDPQRYEMMWTLNQDLSALDLGSPVELTPCRGDALFYHYLCAHAGSMNTSDRPRFALNTKW